jgi:intracellular multiplication protein IcmE
MGVRARNLAALFADVRTRTIIIITAIILISGVIIGYVIYRSRIEQAPSQAQLVGAPGEIQSIPGSFNPTAQYAKLQEEQNQKNAQEAERTGGSAIPTIIGATRTTQGQFNPNQPSGQPWQSGLSFSSLSRVEQTNFTPKDIALNNLKNSGCSPSDLAKARQLGATPEELRAAGCSAEQLLKAGYNPNILQKAGFSACDLVGNNNMSPQALKNAGYSAGELRAVGFNPCQLKHAGYTPAEMLKAGITPEELKGVGFTPQQIAAAGGAAEMAQPTFENLPSGVTAAALKTAGCDPAAVQRARLEGVNASAMREIGCNPSELKSGGYTAGQLKDAGYTPGELAKAGFTPEQLRQAGYTAPELLNAGFTPNELAKAGYTPEEIRQAQAGYVPGQAVSLPPGVTLANLRSAGCDPAAIAKARAEGVSAAAMREVGCNPSNLRAGGYTAKQLKDAGYSAGQLAKAGYTPAELHQAGYTAKQLKAAGFTPEELRRAGYTANDLKDAGYTPAELHKAGYTANELRSAGFTPEEMKNAGYTPAELKNAGYTAQQLRDAGFMPSQLRNVGYSPQELAAAGITTPLQPTQPTIQTPAVSSIPSAEGGGRSPAVSAAEAQQQVQIQQQQTQQMQQQVQGDMQTQVGQLFAAWKPSTQKYEEAEKETEAGGVATGEGGGAGVNEEGGALASRAPPLVKAGTIMFAVLDTAVNSDEPGPILATIVQGKLKGAKLLGRMTTFPPNGLKVMLNFELMTLPRYPESIEIDAVAIDPDTARTAISSYTNHHFLLRYGSLFAASFLEGYGQAFLQSGQTVISTPAALTTVSPQLSGAGKVYVALGNVGNKFGSALEDIVDTPPTVHVYSGTGLGILFMKDLEPPGSATPLEPPPPVPLTPPAPIQ